jgi:hypothetical protein
VSFSRRGRRAVSDADLDGCMVARAIAPIAPQVKIVVDLLGISRERRKCALVDVPLILPSDLRQKDCGASSSLPPTVTTDKVRQAPASLEVIRENSRLAWRNGCRWCVAGDSSMTRNDQAIAPLGGNHDKDTRRVGEHRKSTSSGHWSAFHRPPTLIVQAPRCLVWVAFESLPPSRQAFCALGPVRRWAFACIGSSGHPMSRHPVCSYRAYREKFRDAPLVDFGSRASRTRIPIGIQSTHKHTPLQEVVPPPQSY